MEVTGTEKVATHDEAFKRVEEIEVVDTIPLKGAAARSAKTPM